VLQCLFIGWNQNIFSRVADQLQQDIVTVQIDQSVSVYILILFCVNPLDCLQYLGMRRHRSTGVHVINKLDLSDFMYYQV